MVEPTTPPPSWPRMTGNKPWIKLVHLGDIVDDFHRYYLGIFAATSIFVGVANAYGINTRENDKKQKDRDFPVCRMWILTSCACGGATSTSSSLRGSPAPQQTAALHLMVFPVVSDMVERVKRVSSPPLRIKLFKEEDRANTLPSLI